MAINEKGAVVITGTSTGIGRATALYLDKMGFKVFAGVRRKEDGDLLKKDAMGRLMPVIMDITAPGSIKQAKKIIDQETGGALYGLVNNAGIPFDAPIEFVTMEAVEHVMRVNLTGHIAVIQAFLPMLRKSRGRIVNVGSIAGIQAPPFNGPYNISKAAMHSLTDTLRRELLPQGIKVSLIVPGTIKTAIWGKAKSGMEAITRDFPKEAHLIYGEGFAALQKIAEKIEKFGIAPENVAKVIARAFTRKWPKSRYIVGLDAKFQAVIEQYVPAVLLDRLLLRFIGIKMK